jgi:hypothetical protein
MVDIHHTMGTRLVAPDTDFHQEFGHGQTVDIQRRIEKVGLLIVVDVGVELAEGAFQALLIRQDELT